MRVFAAIKRNFNTIPVVITQRADAAMESASYWHSSIVSNSNWSCGRLYIVEVEVFLWNTAHCLRGCRELTENEFWIVYEISTNVTKSFPVSYKKTARTTGWISIVVQLAFLLRMMIQFLFKSSSSKAITICPYDDLKNRNQGFHRHHIIDLTGMITSTSHHVSMINSWMKIEKEHDIAALYGILEAMCSNVTETDSLNGWIEVE